MENNIIRLNREVAFAYNIIEQYMAGVVIPKGGYVAGGCFKDILSGKKPKDIDVFFRNEADFQYGVNLMDESLFVSEVANAYDLGQNMPPMECICYDFGEPEEMLKKFDFTVCQMAYVDGVLLCSNKLFDDFNAKRLRLTSMHCAERTYIRMLRYAGYGYAPTLDTIARVGDGLIALDPITEVNWKLEYKEQ